MIYLKFVLVLLKPGSNAEPKEEYDFSNQKQISRALTAIIEQLNSTFLQQQKEDQERYTWYIS